MSREQKDLPFELKAVSESGTFSGYASIWNVIDSYGDKVERGAFKKTLGEHKTFPLLWAHETREPIGTIWGREDTTGLAVDGEFDLNVQRAREVHSLMRKGAVRGLSIGYQTIKEDFDKASSARLLKEIKLYEISAVVFQACPGAVVQDVKAADKTAVLELIERYIRL